MADTKTPELSKPLQGKVKIVKLNGPGPFVFKGIRYDTTDMSLSTAEKLIKAGCPYLAPDDQAKTISSASPPPRTI